MTFPRVISISLLAAIWFGGTVAFPTCSLAAEPAAVRKARYHQCPMHPWIRDGQTGRCTVCGMDLVPNYEGENTLECDPSGIVMLPPGSPNVVGVQTVEAKRRPLVRTLRISGTIGEDETRHGVICSPVEGRIDGLAMSCEGDSITRRQPLVTLFSRTLLAAANDYRIALEQGGPAVDQTRRRLEQYGLVWEQIDSIPKRQPEDLHFGILAPRSGTIVKSYVAQGQYVKEGERLFEVADFTTMWFVFSIQEQDLPFVQPQQYARIQTPALPGKTLRARITAISPNLDETTRTARGRVVLENPDRLLKNRAFAEGVVEVPVAEVLAVAKSAVLWAGESPRVYVEKRNGIYEPRMLKLGRAGDDDWEVLEGLSEGDRVVTQGNLLVDGQARLDRAASAPAP
ncbi:hypothetical protein IMCC26134_09790 [Verrucomicrobia bacterium IMCC26134]|nr:hypothetical protein IMCC26134_09790 [Verrucomicrobia bacterium IMCC26134]